MESNSNKNEPVLSLKGNFSWGFQEKGYKTEENKDGKNKDKKEEN